MYLDNMNSLKSIRRHYKKDSRYVNDLYTLCYDQNESLDDINLISSVFNKDDVDIVSFSINICNWLKYLIDSLFH